MILRHHCHQFIVCMSREPVTYQQHRGLRSRDLGAVNFQPRLKDLCIPFAHYHPIGEAWTMKIKDTVFSSPRFVSKKLIRKTLHRDNKIRDRVLTSKCNSRQNSWVTFLTLYALYLAPIKLLRDDTPQWRTTTLPRKAHFVEINDTFRQYIIQIFLQLPVECFKFSLRHSALVLFEISMFHWLYT